MAESSSEDDVVGEDIGSVEDFIKKSESLEDECEWQAIRHKYRGMINDTQKRRDELACRESEFLNEQLDEAKNLFRKVRKTSEAALDSQLISLCAAVGKQQAQAVPTDLLTFQPLEFTEKLITFMGSSRVHPDLEEGSQRSVLSHEQWIEFGKKYGTIVKKAPSFHFIHGSFEVGDVEVKARQKQTKRKDKDIPTKAVTPAAVGSAGTGKEETTAEEVECVLKMLQHLYLQNDNQPICYFEFVVDPNSFSHTIENMFHVSFLIKDSAARIYLDDDRLPVIEPVLETNSESESNARNHQVIMAMTIDDWKDIVETFKIKQPLIPLRDRHHTSEK